VLSTVNERLLRDTDGSCFLTAFYGVLDPASGRLLYCNAGQNPPLHFRAAQNYAVQQLTRTGPLLGALEDQTWQQGTVELGPGDVLVLYTDGITEASNAQENLYGTERLIQAVQAHLGRPVQAIQDSLLADVHVFLGAAPQADDIALVIVARESAADT
jgi:sigma-B regulation protein RsbU (phosphoserine phosphatase)